MKLNNKGFTVVELLASFTLTMIITTLLFQVVLSLKDIYVYSELETSIKNENALIAREINKQINDGNIPVECGSSSCTLKGGSAITFTSNRKIKVGNKTFEMPEGTYINEDYNIYSVCSSSSTTIGNENCYLKVSYTVTGENFTDDVTFNLVSSYFG